ncbi:uncharacterized protein TrAtP1_010399 [Trichoderma atroviride]|uniref:uncharacterized protein n=1 Tax=Hypocrea atroviridis TaxID=63577 RepID=UPI00332E04D6|nr:hypothetical protein TrAtP1_010399 [Trichoderma atroviride]
MSEYDGDIDIHEDPRPNSNDDQQRQDILDGAPKDLKRYLNSKINLGFGSFTLLQTRNFYNTVSTSDKRLLVGKWLEAWCKVKKLSGNFAPNEFTLEVPGDGVSEPVLNSKAYCNGCPALRTQA